MIGKTNFKFETAPLATGSDPVTHRRARLVERLREQAQLATDPSKNVRIITRNKGKGKQKQVVEVKQIIRPTWKPSSTGKVFFWMKGGKGKIEVAPGHHAVVVDSPKAIPILVEALVERVLTGEFDPQLVGPKPTKKGKPAAVPSHQAAGKRATAR